MNSYLESFDERQGGICKRAHPAVPYKKLVVDAGDEPDTA
jgi:hypothetical protein